MKNKMPLEISAKLMAILGAISALLIVVAGIIGSYKNAPPPNPALGSVVGNEIQSNDIVVGGLRTWNFGAGFAATTTSVCSFRTPNATTTWTTLAMGTRMVSAAGSSIIRLRISLAANNWASTTIITGTTTPTGVNGEVVATSTASNTSQPDYVRQQLIPPLTYINFGWEGTSTNPNPGGVAGFCAAKLIQLGTTL